jgi:hypothetical protein
MTKLETRAQGLSAKQATVKNGKSYEIASNGKKPKRTWDSYNNSFTNRQGLRFY